MESMWLDKKYISILGHSVRNFKQKNSNLYNFSCPICGDSKRELHKARGYLYLKEGKYLYKCHNCGFGGSFSTLLKSVNPLVYKQYCFEIYKDKNPDRKFKEEVPEVVKTDFVHIDDKDILPFCQKASDNNDAMKYLMDRKIPASSIDDLYFTDDLNKLKAVFKKYEETKFPKEPRIIIPIRNRNKKIVGIATRSIGKSKLRYINMVYMENEPLIYNLDRVDLNKRVYVTEGAFDSMFLDNSVAVDGADFGKLSSIVEKEKVVIIFDNQPRNHVLKSRIQKIAEEGWSMFVWPKDIQEKDLNMLVENKNFTKESIKNMIDANIYSGLYLKLQLASWFKV